MSREGWIRLDTPEAMESFRREHYLFVYSMALDLVGSPLEANRMAEQVLYNTTRRFANRVISQNCDMYLAAQTNILFSQRPQNAPKPDPAPAGRMPSPQETGADAAEDPGPEAASAKRDVRAVPEVGAIPEKPETRMATPEGRAVPENPAERTALPESTPAEPQARRVAAPPQTPVADRAAMPLQAAVPETPAIPANPGAQATLESIPAAPLQTVAPETHRIAAPEANRAPRHMRAAPDTRAMPANPEEWTAMHAPSANVPVAPAQPTVVAQPLPVGNVIIPPAVAQPAAAAGMAAPVMIPGMPVPAAAMPPQPGTAYTILVSPSVAGGNAMPSVTISAQSGAPNSEAAAVQTLAKEGAAENAADSPSFSPVYNPSDTEAWSPESAEKAPTAAQKKAPAAPPAERSYWEDEYEENKPSVFLTILNGLLTICSIAAIVYLLYQLDVLPKIF